MDARASLSIRSTSLSVHLCTVVQATLNHKIALDPKKLRTAKKAFSAATATSRDQTIDNTLWTETPAERQKRLAEEASGKRKRKANAESELSKEEAAEKRRRQEADEEIRKRVNEHTVSVQPIWELKYKVMHLLHRNQFEERR